jgi:hypothetical protein
VNWWRRYLAWRLRHVVRVEPTADGFAVHRYKTPPQTMRWDEVATIHAFKRDLYAVDMLCLMIADGHGSAIEVDEQMPGYAELIERIDALPGTMPGWQLQVMFPAFDPCLTQIYPAEAEAPAA